MTMAQEAKALLRCIYRHPDPQQARTVINDMMHRISAGEDPEAIEAMYAADLTAMRGVPQA